MTDFIFSAEKPVESSGKIDIQLIISVILLLGLGLFALSICSSAYAERMFHDPGYFIKRQLINTGLGIVVMIVCATINIKVIRRLLPVIVIASLILCLLTFVPGIGSERNGAQRWIIIPFVGSLQPSEIAKLAVVLFLANYFDKQYSLKNENDRSVVQGLIGLGIFVLLVLLQKDFSTAVFIFVVGIFIIFITGSSLIWILPVLGLGVPALLLFVFMEPYRVQRLIAFCNPEYSQSRWNYQAMAAERAISAGGILGTGSGSGLFFSSRIPEIQADYVFAGWAEAMGLLGVLVYFALLLFFSYRGFRSAFNAADRFQGLCGVGCTALILFQSLFNCGVVGGAVPATGIPLPFFSSGGSSMVITLCICGLLMNISRRKSGDSNASEYLV